MRDKISLTDKLATFNDYWSPRTVAQLNNYDVMVVKVKDEFVWHRHDETEAPRPYPGGIPRACEQRAGENDGSVQERHVLPPVARTRTSWATSAAANGNR